jgi:hypothetical protein
MIKNRKGKSVFSVLGRLRRDSSELDKRCKLLQKDVNEKF